jgi:hypothetical protein
MIKRLDPNQHADAALPPRAVDGVVIDSANDDWLYVPASQPAAQQPAAATTVPPDNNQTTATPVSASASVTTEPNGSTTITMTPSNSYAATPAPPMSSTGADLSAISDINSDIVARKMTLEELKFELDRERARHEMKIELRKEQFREDELHREEEKEDSKQSEHWMKAYWRPAMGWLYMLICAFDFIIAPMLSMAMPLYLKTLGAATITYTQWQSLTLSNGGLIHLAFGAILGVTAWTRGQEKIAKMG